MKEISDTEKFKSDSFPKKIKIKETEITKSYEIANELKNLFARIGTNLKSSITNTAKTFKDTQFHLRTTENLMSLQLRSLKEHLKL